jgi:hypothetical protein
VPDLSPSDRKSGRSRCPRGCEGGCGMTRETAADVIRIHPHECPYGPWVAGRWVSASTCHYGDILPLDPPAPKPGRAA